MSLIVAGDIRKSYTTGEVEVPALQRVSFTVEAGAFSAFVGPSGSGKTTLLNLIGCLDKPNSGRLEVASVDVTRLNRRQAAAFRGAHIGFVFQSFNLIPVLTAFENIEYPLVMVQNRPASARRARVLELLEAVGMLEQHQKLPEQLSGGQKQRVAIARALVTQPELVLADEPTANLDSATAAIIIALMKRMQHERNTTFLFSTHDTRIIGAVERIYTLEDGQLVGCKEGQAL